MTLVRRKRGPTPHVIVHAVIILLLFSPTNSQWISFKNSRNPKSSLWYPNMPSPKTLQQRSSVGSSVRGLSNLASNNAPSNPPPTNNAKTRSRPIGHRSVPHMHLGQPTYQTVHGGTINRQETVSIHPRNVGRPSRPFSSQFSQRSGQPWGGKPPSNGNGPHPTVIAGKPLSLNVGPMRNKVGNPPNGYTSSRRLLEVGPGDQVTVTRRPISQIAGALQDSWPNSNTHHHLSPVKNQRPPNAPGGRNYYASNNWGTEVKIVDQPIEIKKPVLLERNQVEDTEQGVDRKLPIEGHREKLVSNTLNTLAKLSPKKPIYVFMRVEGIAAINQGAEAGDVIKKLAGGSKLPFYNNTNSLPKDSMPQVFLAPEDLPPPQNYGKIPIPNLKPKQEATTQRPSFTKILLPGGTKMNSGLLTPQREITTTTTSAPEPPPPPPPSPSILPFLNPTGQTLLNPSTMLPWAGGLGYGEQPLTLEQRLRILQAFQMNQQGAGRPTLLPPQVPLVHQPQPIQLPYQIVPQAPPQRFPQPTPTYPGYFMQQPTHQVPTFHQFQQNVPSILPPVHVQQVPQPQQYPHLSVTPAQPVRYHQPTTTTPRPTPPPTPETTPSHTDILKDILPKGSILESITPMGGEVAHDDRNQHQQPHVPHRQQNNEINHYAQRPVKETQSNSIHNPPEFPGAPDSHLNNILSSLIEKTVTQTAKDMRPDMVASQSQHSDRLGQAQSREQAQRHQYPPPPPQFRGPTPPSHPQGHGQHPSHPVNPIQQAQGMWVQQRMDNNNNGQRGRPTTGPNRNAIKTALSFLGIQSTPKPNNVHPTSPRPPMLHVNPTSPHPPQAFNSPSPTRMIPIHYSPGPGIIPASRRDDHVGSFETDQHRKPPGTVIVHTPDASNPNGQKNTFVISNGENNNLPDLKKIMNVLTGLNQNQQQQNNGHQLPPSPTRPPMIHHPSPSPSPTPHPTRRPTPFSFSNPTGRPNPPHAPQQPNVLIRHPSGTSTPGPILMSTGGPHHHQIVSSTYGPTTPRVFVSSTPGPMGSPSSPAPMNIVKALSHSDVIQLPQFNHNPTLRPHVVQVTTPQSPNKPIQHHRPQLQQQPQVIRINAGPSPTPQQLPNRPGQPQIIFSGAPGTTNAEIMKNIINSIPGVLRPTPSSTTTTAEPTPPGPIVLPPGMGELPPGTVPKIIEVDPNLSPDEIQKSIVESIMKHQQSMHGRLSNGPIVINADPSMSSILEKSPLLKSVSTLTPPSSSEEAKGKTNPSSASTSQTSTTQFTLAVSSTAATKPASAETENSGNISVEPTKSNNFHSSSKEHHHSKEVSDEKPLRKNNRFIDSLEKAENIDQVPAASEEKVIEKVITEEKIVWNPGFNEGEMIPSKITTEERVIVKPHGTKFEKKVEEHVEIPDLEMEHTRLASPELPSTPSTLSPPKSDEESKSDVSDDKGSFSDSSKFTGLLRSKLKYEKMKQKLYPKKNAEKEMANPFLRFLIPSTLPTDAASTVELLESSSLPQTSPTGSPDPSSTSTLITTQETSAAPYVETGRFKIRPGDVSSINKALSEGGPVYGITPTGQTILLNPSTQEFMASPSPSPTPMNPSPGPTSASYIGPSPSPSSFPFIHASPMSPAPTSPTPAHSSTLNPQEEKLIFIPQEQTIQTKNGQNQTVLFTTMNNLPDLMSQLSGTKTEVKVIDDLKSFQATLAKVQANHHQTSSSSSTHTPTSPIPTVESTPDRRMDAEEKPFTWRPNENGPVPTPTLESLRARFPAGFGANVLHAMSAGFAANDKTIKNGNWPQQPPQLLYTMHNGVPVAINPVGGYQPILLQGTKEPILAYYGYNWNTNSSPSPSAPPPPSPSTFKPVETDETEPTAEPTYTSKFRGNAAPTSPEAISTTTGENTNLAIDPVSQEETEIQNENRKQGSSKSDNSEDNSQGRRRLGALKEEVQVEEDPERALTSSILSKRIDESDEQEIHKKKPVRVHSAMFVNSGEKTEDETTPKAKLPILLAPSIISRKSVVSKTGSTHNNNAKVKPTLAAILATTAVTSKTSPSKSKTEDDDLRETQAELKSLLKKLRQKLGSHDDIYELYDDYYEEIEPVPSTKATTTTTSTKATSKPVKAKKSSKKNSKNKKKDEKNTKSKDSKKKKNKAKKDKSKPKPKKTTTITPKPIKSTKKPVATPTVPTTVVTSTGSTSTTTNSASLNHQRHPISSIETFTSSPTISTTAFAQAYQASSEVPTAPASPTVAETMTPSKPSTTHTSPTVSVSYSTSTSEDSGSVAFIYPQGGDKDVAASKVHHRKRPLWVRRKTMGGSIEGGLESLAQPSSAQSGKVIRLVRRKKPVAPIRRRVVIPAGSYEVSPSTTVVSTTTLPTPTTSSSTVIPVDVLFETNQLKKRVGIPDSNESRSQSTARVNGKRKLKLIRLKGQRAQWKLRMSDEDSENGSLLPRAEKLVAPPPMGQQLPQASPLSSSPQMPEPKQIRQETSSSIEATVCVRGRCELISNQ